MGRRAGRAGRRAGRAGRAGAGRAGRTSSLEAVYSPRAVQCCDDSHVQYGEWHLLSTVWGTC